MGGGGADTNKVGTRDLGHTLPGRVHCWVVHDDPDRPPEEQERWARWMTPTEEEEERKKEEPKERKQVKKKEEEPRPTD